MIRLRLSKILLASAIAMFVLAGCERPPMESQQLGYRGTGMDQISNPRLQSPDPQIPAVIPAVAPGGPLAGEVFENVQVLGDLSVSEFTRTMSAITEWVSPAEGCNYCHDPQNLASDDVYTKVVSRRMLQMTQDINQNWGDHVADTGVTCYSCHGGEPVPANVWFADDSEVGASPFAGNLSGQNMGAASVGYTSLPTDPFSTLLVEDDGGTIRVLGDTALPDGEDGATIQTTEQTYGLMMHMSDALGVNCTFCHNTNSFGTWTGSTPQRATAWHGLQMVKELNQDYLIPLAPVYPENRMGPLGDPPKASCATCHGGLPKPLGGAQMAGDYPAFRNQ